MSDKGIDWSVKKSKGIDDLVRYLRPTDTVAVVYINHAVQVTILRPGEKPYNVTRKIAVAYGYLCLPNGLACNEVDIVLDLIMTVPQIRKPNGELNIALNAMSFSQAVSFNQQGI